MQTNENTFINAVLQANTFILSAGCVSDQHVNLTANINPTKMRHRYRQVLHQSAVVSGTYPVHVCQAGGGGTLNNIKVGCVVPSGTLSVDLLKNNTSLLGGPQSLGSTAARTLFQPTLSQTALVAGDWIDVVIAVSSGTPPQGLYVCCEIDEYPS